MAHSHELRATPRFVRTVVLSLVLGVALLPGCGYRLVHGDGRVDGARTVAIETLQNDSTLPGAELLVTSALRKEFLRRGQLRLVSDPKSADLVVQGRLLPVQISARSFSSVVLALEYSVRMTIALKVWRRDGTEVPIDSGSLTESEIYLASSDVEAGRKNREEAMRRISLVLAGRFLDSLYIENAEGNG